MDIYPALDLLDGKCVRLKEGNFEDRTVYFEDPSGVVAWIAQSGAHFLHLVDLSGARDPSQRQHALIHRLISNCNLNIQYGGGIRTLQDVQALLDLGVKRVVLGSLSISNPDLTQFILKKFGSDRIALALDVKLDAEGMVRIATDGWRKTSDQGIDEWIRVYQRAGLKRILCTDIQCDGMMNGPSFSLYQTLIEKFPELEFQASGGVSSLDDLRALSQLGVHSAVVGKALYEGKLSLQEALLLC